MFIDHSALKYLVNNPVLRGRICRWILLFHEFYFHIIVKLCRLNASPDHLLQIERGEEPTNIEDGLPDTKIFKFDMVEDYYE